MPFIFCDKDYCGADAEHGATVVVGSEPCIGEVPTEDEDDYDQPSSAKTGRAIVLLHSLESKVSLLDERLSKRDKVVADTLAVMRSNLEELKPLLPKEQVMDPQKDFTPCVSDSAFPMMVMKMTDFLDLNILEPHTHLLKSGRLQEAPKGGIVHFISHQWLGNDHPDPEHVQLKQLQHFFRMCMLPNGFHALFTEQDWAAFSEGAANKTHAAAHAAAAATHRRATRQDTSADFKDIFAEDIANGYIWLDYASIPQITDEMQDEERKQALLNQGRAIESISNYIEAATYFYICARAALHENKSLCDFASWRNRGWCRLEEWANFLSPTKTMMPVVITEQPKVTFIEFFDFFLFRAARRECSVFHGQFKCCQCGHMLCLPGGHVVQTPCDKDLLQPVVTRMYDAKLEALLAAGNEFLYRVYKVMEPAVLAGSKGDRIATVCSPDETIASFLQRMRLPDDPAEGDGSGAPAVEWAAFMGHTRMVSRLMQEGCSVEIADKGGLTPLLGAALSSEPERTVKLLVEEGRLSVGAINAATKGMGITALDRAAKGGKVQVCRYLLEMQASVNVCRSDGATPLMSASEAGHAAVIELLLEHGAEVKAVDAEGQGCLHRAARKFSPHCVERLEREEGTIVLLQARGDAMLMDKFGMTPLQIATEESNIEFIHAMFSYEQLRNQKIGEEHRARSSTRRLTVAERATKESSDNLRGHGEAEASCTCALQ